jgi:aminoglycoside phosphotransferase (APT) family kinase protein
VIDLPLDLVVIEHWLTERQLLPDAPVQLRLLAGGSQNVMVEAVAGDRAVVLRFPPPRSGERGDATMRREAKILSGLTETSVPHPRFLAVEHDTARYGSVFFAMERIEGWSVSNPPATLEMASAGLGAAMGETLSILSEVQPETVGLDSDRATGFLDRQVDRWLKQLNSYRSFDGYTGSDLPHVETVSAWLRAHTPPGQRPGVLHGDMHLGNVLFRGDRPVVAALVDWELSTVGDPLVDLGQLLVTWPEPDGQSVVGRFASSRVVPSDGPPEIVEAYARGSGRDLSSLGWYQVLACFRLGVLLEGTTARAAAGLAPPDVGRELHEIAVRLFERGRSEIASSRDTFDAREASGQSG